MPGHLPGSLETWIFDLNLFIMSLAKVKEEYRGKVIAFGRTKPGVPLGAREDIDALAIIALESNDRSLLRLFEQPMPALADLKTAKTETKIAAIQAKAEEPAVPKTRGPRPNKPVSIKEQQTTKGEAGMTGDL